METFLEDHLVVIDTGEFKEDAGSGLREGEAAFELHLLANGGSLLHAEAVRGSEEESALGQEVL